MAYRHPSVSIAEAYRVLGVQNGESLEVVRAAYKRLALATHPDKNPDNEEATQQFQQIGEAYHALATHLDNSSHRQEYADPFDAYDDDDYEDDGDYVYLDFEDLLYMYEEIFGGRRRNSYFCPDHGTFHYYDNRDHRNYTPKSRRSQRTNRESYFKPDYSRDTSSSPRETPEQAAARRAEETARAKERMRQQRENEMKDAATRQKEKAERKREKAKQDRQSAAKVLASQQEKVQALRSKVFAAARNGDADAVKKGVWEQDVDPAGGEIKPGCHHLVRQKPVDPHETLLHIAARLGNKDLLEWLGSHSGDIEERTSEDYTAFHVALKHGQIPILKYFFEAYPTNDEDSKGIYSLSGTPSLLSLAVESHVPEAVWMILDNKLFQRKEIVDVWKDLSSPAGTDAFINGIEQKNVKGTAKKKEILDEVVNLIVKFGGFARPPTPPTHNSTNSSDSIPPREPPTASSSGSRPGRDSPSQRQQAQPRARSEKQPEHFNQWNPKRNAGDQSTSETRPEASQNARGGRGRGRGRVRGRGRGRP